MPIQVDVWSDYICPFCYAVTFSLKALQESHDVEIHWHAYELRPEGSPPMDAEYKEYIETKARPQFNQMMREQHGIEPNPGPFNIITRLPFIGEKAALALYGEDMAKAYHGAVIQAYWRDAEDISDRTMLERVAVSVGMDVAPFNAALADPQYEKAVLADIYQAYRYNLQGVPALIFANKYLVSGAQPYDTLVDVVEQNQAMGSAVEAE